MIPVVFVNCRRQPFVSDIAARRKLIETRTRNTLRAVAGRRVYIAETGNGSPVVRCSAMIGHPVPVRSMEGWEQYRELACIPAGSQYDWKPETVVKWLYPLYNVEPIAPFVPPEDVRHGRVWMEYNPGKEAAI